jgi:hypothetical protein
MTASCRHEVVRVDRLLLAGLCPRPHGKWLAGAGRDFLPILPLIPEEL